MANHVLRGAVTAWMGLIVLQTVGTAGGSGKVAGLFTDINGLVTRALSPNVPAIPDRRGGARGTAIVGPDGKPTGGYLDPRGRYIPPSDSTVPTPSAGQTHSEGYQGGYAPSLSPLNA